MVAVGVASFVLNAARFSWRRFLPFAVVSILWGCLIRYSAEFALVLAAVIALNGQEWYLARFGTRGRLGTRWTLWSTGGRVVTLLLIFAVVGIDITGYEIYNPDVHFGLGTTRTVTRSSRPSSSSDRTSSGATSSIRRCRKGTS